MNRSLILMVLSGWAVFVGQGFAQHHHHHGHVHIHPGHFGHHHHFFYVQPHHHHHATFYTYQNQSYYIPPRPVVTSVEQAPPPQPQVIEFGSFAHVRELADRMSFLTNELCLGMHYNYPHNPAFKEVYRDTYGILQTGKTVLNLSGGDRKQIADALSPLDEQFHRIQEQVRGWSRVHRRQIGNLGVVEKMGQLESIIHHLLYDAGIEPDHSAQTNGNEQAPPPE
jgi:hypothetical protein